MPLLIRRPAALFYFCALVVKRREDGRKVEMRLFPVPSVVGCRDGAGQADRVTWQ